MEFPRGVSDKPKIVLTLDRCEHYAVAEWLEKFCRACGQPGVALDACSVCGEPALQAQVQESSQRDEASEFAIALDVMGVGGDG